MMSMSRINTRLGLVAMSLLAIGSIIAAGCSDPATAVSDPAHHDDEVEHHDDEADHAEDPADHHAVEVDLVVAVEMSEFAFSPDPVEIPAGSTVKFEFTNTGAIDHEAVIGDREAQNDAKAAMADEATESDHNSGHHQAPTIVLGPGESGHLIVTFDQGSELIIGCHITGHWDAGMHSAIAAT
jgi:uncharacterized cupredoxin-like copper-binding protein